MLPRLLAALITLSPLAATAQDRTEVTLRVTRGADGPLEPDMLWDILHDGRMIIDSSVDTRTDALTFQSMPQVLHLSPGGYTAFAYGVGEDISTNLHFTVTDIPMTVTLVLPTALDDASLTAPSQSPAGSEILVHWTGPNAPGDYIALSDPEDGLNTWITQSHTANGTPVTITLPDMPAAYEIRYYTDTTQQPLAVTTIVVTAN